MKILDLQALVGINWLAMIEGRLSEYYLQIFLQLFNEHSDD